MFASYTLVAYPIVRNMGLSANKAVAAAVGATVLTDTLALVILAFISGSTTGDASGVELILQVVLGLAILVAFTFGVLPPVARWFFRTIGTQRTLRYVFMLAALLSAGVVAEVVGIESIVGAFFCGLALNRLVPNEGEFMERIEFFGSALLIPCFLVSIGTVIDPAVLVDPGTLGLAGCVRGRLHRRQADRGAAVQAAVPVHAAPRSASCSACRWPRRRRRWRRRSSASRSASSRRRRSTR